jgi:hypothetical protein
MARRCGVDRLVGFHRDRNLLFRLCRASGSMSRSEPDWQLSRPPAGKREPFISMKRRRHANQGIVLFVIGHLNIKP